MLRVPRETIALVSLVALGVAAGIAVRIWILRTPALGYLDSDEAVPGLMARHFLHGHLSSFYWGQHFNGSAEVALVALAFVPAGSHAVLVNVVPIVLYAVGAALLWRIGVRTIGPRGAAVAAVLMWIWSAFFVWRSTREYGYNEVLLVCGLAVLLFALRLREQPSAIDAARFGAAVGIGWWSSFQIALVALPATAWLVWRRRDVLRHAPIAAATALVTASPWIVDNVHSGWASFHASPGAVAGTYPHRLGVFVRDGLPMTFGVRTLFTRAWLPTPTLGKLLFALLLLAVVVVLAWKRSQLELVLVVLLPFPFIYAFSGFTYNPSEPRYLGLLAPLLALVLAVLLADLRVAAVVLAGATALTVVALVKVRDAGGVAPGAPDVRAPTTVAPVIRTLQAHGITRAWADYWVAYRITFLTRERIIVAPTAGDRYPRYTQLVQQSGRVAHIFVAGTASEAPQRSQLLAAGDRRTRAGPYVVYLPR